MGFFFFFQDRVLGTVCPGCLWTGILLISASWVAKIISVSHSTWLHSGILNRVFTCSLQLKIPSKVTVFCNRPIL
jgi:hypothetical protein